MRFVSAAALYWLILIIRRIPIPSGRALLGTVIYGSLSIGASYAFLYWGLLKIPASLTMIILSVGPLLTMVFATAHRLERFRWSGLVGALTALAGIILAVGEELGNSIPLLSLLAVLAGAACIAEASVLYKLFPKSDPLATNAIGSTAGSMLLILVSLIAGEAWRLPTTPTTWAAYAYLVLVGSVVLFYVYLFVLTRWTTTATSYAFLLFPVATIIIAAWLSDEAITLRFLAGGLVVLAGVWLGAIRGTGQGSADGEPSKQTGKELEPPPQPGCA